LETGAQWGPFRQVQTLWGGKAAVNGRVIDMIAPARDVSVIALG
jgi:hypothetical protein